MSFLKMSVFCDFRNYTCNFKQTYFISQFTQGKIEAQGTPADLSKIGLDITEFIGCDESGKHEESAERRISQQISTNETTHNEKLIDETVEGVGLEESSMGKVKGSLAAKYFRAGGNWFWIFLVFFSFGLTQFLASSADYWVSVW